MAGKLLYIFIVFFITPIRVVAQPPVGKCISGDCMNGQGVYQLNSYTSYQGGFLNGVLNGPGKIYNRSQLQIIATFINGHADDYRYTGRTMYDTMVQLLFEGKAHVEYYQPDYVQKNWQRINFMECNGRYFTFSRDSGRVYIGRGLYDTTRYSFSGKINSEGKITGSGKIYKGAAGLDHDFGTGDYTSDLETLGRIASNKFAISKIDFALFKCISGDCKNGKGTARIAQWAIYEGGFRNGKINGPGKLRHENNSWYYTGNFQADKILDYQFYQQVPGSNNYALKRRSTGAVKIYDEATAQNTWTTNNYYYWDNQYFKIEETDTITWYYQPDFYLKVRPDKKRAILFVNKKMYAFILNEDPSIVTEDILREHLKRADYQNKYAYQYDKDIMKKPVATKTQPPPQNGPRLLNAAEIRTLTKMMADQAKATMGGATIAEGYLDGGDTYVKYKTIYADAAPGDVFAIFAFVKYSAPVTISIPQWNNMSNNITCDGNRITDAGATVHPYNCFYANQTQQSGRVKFEINVTNSPEPGYYIVTKSKQK